MGAWPMVGMPGDATVLARSFEEANQLYGPVPIWWWGGQRLGAGAPALAVGGWPAAGGDGRSRPVVVRGPGRVRPYYAGPRGFGYHDAKACQALIETAWSLSPGRHAVVPFALLTPKLRM